MYEYNELMKKCPICGKVFYVPDRVSWVYRERVYSRGGDKTTYFCTWGCFRKNEKDVEEERRKKFDERRYERGRGRKRGVEV